MIKFCQSIFTGASVVFFWLAGGILLLHSSSLLANDESALDDCLETFWYMYEEVMREELDARFDVVECGKDGPMPYVLIGVTLLACENAISQQTNFFVRGPEPKSYLPEYKREKECSIQGPFSCGEDWIMNTVIDIQFDKKSSGLGKWTKFVSDDVCEIAMTDYLNDQEN